MRVGLTGGVGSGKSTVAALLAELGATVIDADAIAREVVERGTAGFDSVVAEFGDGVLTTDGDLDRARLAELVFNDDTARDRLNAIVHPLVGARFAELNAATPSGAIVVYDVPLLVEGNLAKGFDVVLVVETTEDVRLERLAKRGMHGQDARARMAAQASDEQRRAVAHEVIVNSGSRSELQAQVEQVWARLRGRAEAERAPGGS
jgi:dephospho-CoA kinase